MRVHPRSPILDPFGQDGKLVAEVFREGDGAVALSFIALRREAAVVAAGGRVIRTAGGDLVPKRHVPLGEVSRDGALAVGTVAPTVEEILAVLDGGGNVAVGQRVVPQVVPGMSRSTAQIPPPLPGPHLPPNTARMRTLHRSREPKR